MKIFGEHRNGNYYLINSRTLTKYLNYSLSLSSSKENKTKKGEKKTFKSNHNEAGI